MIHEVIKRDATKVAYDPNKIRVAINKANNKVDAEYRISNDEISEIIARIECNGSEIMDIEDIQNMIVLELMYHKKYQLSIEYITYRYKRQLMRKSNTTDESILGLVNGRNEEVSKENSNKRSEVNSTQRDLIAGEVSKDLSRRELLPKHIVEAHDKGIIHFHDMDYFLQPMFNCCLPDFRGMLKNGTCINDTKIETPKSFSVACTQVTQIMASIASNQYGGQTFYSNVLGEYLAVSREKIRKRVSETVNEYSEIPDTIKRTLIESLVQKELMVELKSGVQTIQYQINTMYTSCGQSPFVTIFLYLEDNDPYLEENAMIIEEILKQRIAGIKNREGIVVSPTFPKLIFALDENNIHKDSKFYYLKKLAMESAAKRMSPDFISAKKMREYYGDVFSCMGCRSFLSQWKDPETGKNKWEGRLTKLVGATLNNVNARKSGVMVA